MEGERLLLEMILAAGIKIVSMYEFVYFFTFYGIMMKGDIHVLEMAGPIFIALVDHFELRRTRPLSSKQIVVFHFENNLCYFKSP